MKNKHFDWMRSEAKKYAKTWRRANQLTPLGNALIHCYDNHQHTEGWWDDVAFKLGSQVVMVNWVHPRMEFANQSDDAAYATLPPSPDWNLGGGRKIYKKIGKNKNRKRVVAYECSPTPLSYREWSDLWAQRKVEVRQVIDIVVQPSMKIEQRDWCRGVTLCIPIEAVDADSVEQVAEITKKLLRGETTLEELYPGYTYTKEDWAKDADGKDWSLM